MIDWTFRVGDIVTFAGLIVGGLYFLARLESQLVSVRTQNESLSKAVTKVEGQMETVAAALVKVAVQDERLKSHSLRLSQLEADIRQLETQGGPYVEPR